MKTIKIAIAALLLTSGVIAQDRRPARERIEAMKIGFLTNRLNLTPDEAKAFWPVYNQYSAELEKIRSSHREIIDDARENFDSMSNADVEKAVDNEIIFRQNELDIIKKYHPQFKKILPMRKVAKLYKSEEDFKRKLLDMIQDKREGRMQGPKGPPPPR